jgi:hypothetical protein
VNDRSELECVEQVLDAHQIMKEMAPGIPFTLHGRVAHACMELAALRLAVEEFIAKVDSGQARSVRTYAALQAALAIGKP